MKTLLKSKKLLTILLCVVMLTACFAINTTATGLAPCSTFRIDPATITVVEPIRAFGSTTVPSKLVTFTIYREGWTSRTDSVDVYTVDETAISGSDYEDLITTVNFAYGQTSTQVQVAIYGNSPIEANETFKVQLAQNENSNSGFYGYWDQTNPIYVWVPTSDKSIVTIKDALSIGVPTDPPNDKTN